VAQAAEGGVPNALAVSLPMSGGLPVLPVGSMGMMAAHSQPLPTTGPGEFDFVASRGSSLM